MVACSQGADQNWLTRRSRHPTLLNWPSSVALAVLVTLLIKGLTGWVLLPEQTRSYLPRNS